MDKAGSGLDQAGLFAGGQVDRVAVDRAFAQKTLGLIGIQIIAGLGEQVANPGNLVRLFGKVGLHQAVGVLAPERPQSGELFGRRSRRKARRDDIGQPVDAVPFLQQRLAVVIGRLRRVAQAVRGVPIHAGLAGKKAHPPQLGGGEDCVHAGGVDRGIAADRSGTAREDQVEISVSDFSGICGIAKAHFLGEGVSIQPVDQPLAPAGDDRSLRIVNMGVDESGRDQLLPMVVDPGLRMARAQVRSLTHGGNAALVDQDPAFGQDLRRIGLRKGIAVKADHLSQ